MFTVAEAQATARAYGTDAVIFPDMAHDMMLEPAWQQVADKIIGWLRDHDTLVVSNEVSDLGKGS